MSYTDLRDFCPELIIPIGPFGTHIPTLTIEIEKLGGGTLEKEYTGTWRYQLRKDDVVEIYGQDLETGTPTTHIQAAKNLAEFLAANTEDASGKTTASRMYLWLSEASED